MCLEKEFKFLVPQQAYENNLQNSTSRTDSTKFEYKELSNWPQVVILKPETHLEL